VDPRGRPYYWIGGDAPTGVPERGTDVGALAEGFVSVTPLQLDLTAYRALTDLNTWQLDAHPLTAQALQMVMLEPSSKITSEREK
jgi:5'-nucleotidase